MSNASNSLLWQIQAKGESKCSYILGTMHVQDARAFSLVDRSLPYLEQCTLFCAEYDLSSTQQPSPELMMQLQAVPSLDQLLGQKSYEKLKKVLYRQIHLNLDQYRVIHPMMLSSLIQRQMLGNEEPIILDATLWAHAGEMGLTRKGIETVESQIVTMLSLPMKWHVDTLKGMARNFSKFRKKIDKLLGYYQQEQLSSIHKASMKIDGHAKRILSYSRNIQMSEFIVDAARDQSGFFAIGAAHLYGKSGVLRLVKKQDFIVRPLK